MLRTWFAREKSLREIGSEWLAARSRAEVLFVAAFYVVQSASEQLFSSLLWRASSALFQFWYSRPRRYVLLMLLAQVAVVLYAAVKIVEITEILKELRTMVEKRQERMPSQTIDTGPAAMSSGEHHEEGPQ